MEKQIKCVNFRKMKNAKTNVIQRLAHSFKVRLRKIKHKNPPKGKDGLERIPCKNALDKDLDRLGRESNTGLKMQCIQTKPNGPVVLFPCSDACALAKMYPDGIVIESEFDRNSW